MALAEINQINEFLQHDLCTKTICVNAKHSLNQNYLMLKQKSFLKRIPIIWRKNDCPHDFEQICDKTKISERKCTPPPPEFHYQS